MGSATDRSGKNLTRQIITPGATDFGRDETPAARGSVQILVPVYNEGDNVRRLYEAMATGEVHFDSLRFIYDQDGDTSLPYIEELRRHDPRVIADHNLSGRGALRALRWGFDRCQPGPVIVLMGDNADDVSIIPQMVALWSAGATIVCPSRYMPGGERQGGGRVKGFLSQAAGRSLNRFGFPTADPTNNFKLYDGRWLGRQTIRSRGGFEIALELCCNAFAQNCGIVELPTQWRDRTEGRSRFRLLAWFPRYAWWYGKLLVLLVRARLHTA